jgi:hypothetical protein
MPYRWGTIFFAGHTDDISRFSDAGMVFSAPCWDQLIPLMMVMHGCRIHQTEPVVRHLKHTRIS